MHPGAKGILSHGLFARLSFPDTAQGQTALETLTGEEGHKWEIILEQKTVAENKTQDLVKWSLGALAAAEKQRAQKVEEELKHTSPFRRIYWDTQRVMEYDYWLNPVAWACLPSQLIE